MIGAVMMEMPGSDEWFMRQAMKESRKALVKGEVPIGAIVVKDGRVIGRGWNQVEALKDATAHAEMIALTAARRRWATGGWKAAPCTSPRNRAPCARGAIVHCRPDRVVFGCPDARTRSRGRLDQPAGFQPSPQPQVRGASRRSGDECLHHLQEFFRAARLAAKERKKLAADSPAIPDENGEDGPE